MTGLLEGRTVLLTASAGSGIGFATALRCAEHGATVAISDANESRLERAVDAFADAVGQQPIAILADVTDPGSVDALWEQAVSQLGHVDVFVNNAGRGLDRSIMETSDEDWSLVIDVSLTGAFRCLRAAFSHMLPRATGSIVNVSSVLGWRAQPRQAAYAAAKAGVMALTRVAAMEAADSGVRVNAVAPSLAMHANLSRTAPQELLDELVAKETFGRAADPSEVADVIVFLASDMSSYMTGECISVSSQHP